MMTTHGSISVVIYDSYKFIKDTITNFIVTIFNVQSKYVITKHMYLEITYVLYNITIVHTRYRTRTNNKNNTQI